MANVFLDASVLRNKQMEEAVRYDVQQNRIKFDFPGGFTQLPLIEECRAMNALDLTIPDNFDLLYDITMQMLTGKVVVVYFIDNNEVENEIGKFVVVDRYMNLRAIDVFDEYPILMNWLVEFVAGYLGKKFPRSLQSIQAKMSEREEHMKSLKKSEVQVKMSSLDM